MCVANILRKQYDIVKKETLPIFKTESVLYTPYLILNTLYSILYTLYSILYSLYFILYTLYSILYTLYFISCLCNCPRLDSRLGRHRLHSLESGWSPCQGDSDIQIRRSV